MNNICNLNIIGTLAELSFVQKYSKTLKIEIEKIRNKCYHLYLYSSDSRRVTVFEIFFNENVSSTEAENLQSSSLKTFCLPCNISELLSINGKLWCLTDEVIIDIKPHLECAVKESLRIKDATSEDFTDVDFDHKQFQMMQELNVWMPKFQKCNLQNGKFFVRSFLSKHKVFLCYEKIPTLSWNLQLVISEESSKGFSSKFVSVLNISLSSMKSIGVSLKDEGMTERHKPVVIIVQPESISCPNFSCSRNNIFEKYFGINLLSNNCVCLVGFSDGKVMWASFSLSRRAVEKNTELQFMYDLKQPIANIHFMEKIGNVEGYGFVLIIGSFGKVALLATEKLFSNATKIESAKCLYVVTSYLQVSFKESILFSENILYVCRAGNLYASTYIVDTSETKELKIVSKKFDVHGIISAVIVDKEIGLILLRTSIGSLYLVKYEAVVTQSDNVSSLPSVMAQCLHQSEVMRELISIQSFQHRFFAALTVFASLKHKAICFEENFDCSASEITSSKKILLDINLQSLKQLNLDPDLWNVATSIHSCFSEDYKVVSKTIPYSSDQASLFIELDESELQMSSSSALPLLIEVGLVLNIPHEWKNLDCFTLVEKSLPIYIKIQAFVMHEFYFLTKNTNTPKVFHNSKSPGNILQTINEVAKVKPISNLLKLNIDSLADLPESFQFCFPISSIQEILDKNKETDPCHFVSKILLRKSIKDFSQGKESLSCRNKPVTISVEKIESMILIELTSKDFGLLLGMRMAVLELLLSHQLRCEINPQAYVSIPGSISSICEDVSEKLNTCWKDINFEESCRKSTILMLYKELRQEISEKLPVL